MIERCQNNDARAELSANINRLEDIIAEPKTGQGPGSGSGKGHIRSASHGQPGSSNGSNRPSLLKTRPNNLNVIGTIHGHQRAFSQGQIDSSINGKKIGHHRIGSKTDFILPPNHRDTNSAGSISKLSSRFNSGFFPGHSRSFFPAFPIYFPIFPFFFCINL